MHRPLSRRAALALTAPLGACALPRLPGVPDALASSAQIPGIPGARFFSDEADPELLRWVLEQRDRAVQQTRRRQPPEVANMLALSGGGEDGAFGAGLLTEWTRRGDRPQFRVVTGVSTGALTAPFALLGPARDEQLRQVYTELDEGQIFSWRRFTAVVFDDALADSAPLAATIARFLDAQMLAEIAAAYEAGQLLLIGTTDLDSRRGVVWNMGAIARAGTPEALALARRVLLASASIPGAFPPVMFDVEADGRRYQEMHVDGGAVAQLFLFPGRVAAEARDAGARPPPTNIWVIRNGRLRPQRAMTQRRLISVLGASVSSMTAASGSFDVQRVWLQAQRQGMTYRLAFVGEDFTVPYQRPFEPAYMRALFEYGQQRMRSGTAWVDRPPGEA
jgi:hypothetical protein